MSEESHVIRRQMPEDHNPYECIICRFLSKPCPHCNKYHMNYAEAKMCIQIDLEAHNQYMKAMSSANRP